MKVNNSTTRKPWHLFSSVLTAIIIVSFIAPFSYMTAYALDIPQPTYPEDYAITTVDTDPPLGIPSFSWTIVPGANIYRLQVDSEIGFNQPIYINITTRNSSYSPKATGELFLDGEWYWRVRVEDPSPVGEWSPIFHFTKTWATPENKPELIAPEDGEALAFFDTPGFSWSFVTGAARYRFQVATTPGGFDSPILSIDTLATSYQPKDRLNNGLYYWRIVPMDTADHLGTPSVVQSFTVAYGTYTLDDMVPTMIDPEDETFPTFTPTFHWSAIDGAESYRLEYTSDETCDFSLGTSIETHQTYYTPTDTFRNDFRYCWHVRVESGSAVGDWSSDENGDPWHFQKKWYLQPQLLTPTNLYQTGLYPLYSWTPVPGASRYLIQIADNPSFISNSCYQESVTANTTYTPQTKYCGTAHYWWRVKPIDGGDESGLLSNVGEYQSYYTSTAPILVYPLYYYLPNDPNFYGENLMNPYEDRTVALPIFMWHRVIIPSAEGGVYAPGYRIQVDTTPYFNTIVWEYDTENTSATPTSDDDFTPIIGQDYYWRVCPLDSISGNCRTNPFSGLIWWSQIWKARFDSAYNPDDPNPWVLPPTSDVAPQLLRPTQSQESVETTPLLEWWPLQEATQYQVEISRDPGFTTNEISKTVNLPAYTPAESLAQRSLGRTDFGTFYWHVRGFVAGAWGGWSESRRFQIASQSEWRYTRTIGDIANQLLIGNDQVGDTTPTYDLTSLYASQSDSHWFLGFNANLVADNMTYVFYVDLDHLDDSGATYPPERPYTVTTIAAHQPEYAIYVDVIAGVINAENVWVFAWNGSSWDFGQTLPDIGGSVYVNSGYVELQLPSAALGMQQTTSSASIMLFSIDIGTNLVEDSVPSDPNAPGSALLSRFSAVSDRMNLIFPPSTISGDPRTTPSLLPFYWDWPTGSDPSTPFAGSRLEVHLDPAYTSLQAYHESTSNSSYFGMNNDTLVDDIVGDNIYYWRVQPRYKLPGLPEAFGAWSGGWSFRRLGFVVDNLYTSTITSTLTFGWDMAEGADLYRLQVATDPNFSNRVINITTPMTTYTPPDSLAQDLYYWRVQIVRYDNIVNDWAEGVPFEYVLPVPGGLTPDSGPDDPVHYAPTFCWSPLILYDTNGDAVFTAWKYSVQVSQDPNFSNIYDSAITNNHCWTPTKGYHDGAYYWHVAMYDGNNRMGPYSPSATFTKQYPIAENLSPTSGTIPQTPTFSWDPVPGAATYVFESSWYSTFSPLYDSAVTINTHYTPTKIYQTNKAYYWRVAIRDRDGRQGPFTDAFIIIGVENKTYLPLVRR